MTQHSRALAAFKEPEVEITTLPNGVRVVTDRMPGLASAVLGVWVGAGGRHESAAENGVAHFLEHMAFKGTPTRTARRIAEEIEEVGGELNAYTSREATAYHARVLADDVERAFGILADILRNPLFETDDVAVEQGVILQELGQVLDTPDDVVFEWAQEIAFPDQPIGRSILGTEASVRSIDGGSLRNFMDATYAPEKMIVGGAGAVDHALMVRLAEAAFGDLEPRPGRDAPAAVYGGGERREDKPLEQAHLVLGFRSPGYLADDFYDAQVYSTVLGGGMSSRLFQEVREARGLAYSVFSQAQAYSDNGLMMIYAGLGGDRLSEVFSVVARELQAVAEKAGAEETARAKAQIRAGVLMGLESPGGRIERAARSLLSLGRVRKVGEVLEKVERIDAERVRAFGARLIDGPTPTVSLYGPVASAPELEAFQRSLAG